MNITSTWYDLNKKKKKIIGLPNLSDKLCPNISHVKC